MAEKRRDMDCNLSYNIEGTALTIKVGVDGGYTLSKIAIDTHDTYPYTQDKFIAEYTERTDLERALGSGLVIEDGDIQIENEDGSQKDIKLSWMLVFVHVYEVSNTNQEDVVHEVFAVYNKREAFTSLYEHICNLKCECEIPNSFACAFLRLEGIDACLHVGDMHTAALMWQHFFCHKTDFGNSENENNNCGCGGMS